MNHLNPPAPPRGPDCPAAAVLEAISAGEAADERVARHLPGCAACRGYVEALAAGSEAFRRARPPELFLRQLDRRAAREPRRARWRWLAALVPVAAAAAFLVLLPRGDDVLLKSAAAFRVAALSPGAAQPRLLGPDARVRAGDSLRFAWEGPGGGHLLVLERDGTGAASVFWPWHADASAPVAAGRREFLDGAVVLDDAPGPEWLVAVFSPRPLQAAPLLAQLRAAGDAAPALSCADCRVESLRLLKQP